MIPETKEIEIIPKGDIKIAECGGNLDSLKRETKEAITRIRSDGDRLENERRINEEQKRETRAQKIDAEVYANYNKNVSIFLKWDDLQKMENCEQLATEINNQNEECKKIIDSKNDLIQEFTDELKSKDDEYVKSLKTMGRNIDELLSRMRKQFKDLSDDYSFEMKAIENAFIEEREDILKNNEKEINDLFKKHSDDEERYASKRLGQEDKFMKELDDLRRKDASAYANQKISLETELQTLEKYLEDMKAVYQLNEEKLEFNDKVLSERENVNQNTKKTLTKKERRLKDNKSTVRAQYFNQDRRFKKENYTTTEDYKRITRQFKELQKKFRHFEKSDKKRFDEIWEMNDAEVKAMIDKIIKADKVVHVQQLGIPWVPPSDPIFGFSDASSIMQHSVSAIEGSRLGNKSEGGMLNVNEDQSVLTTQKLDEKIQRIKEVFSLLIQEGGFLIDEKVHTLMQDKSLKQQTELQIGSICNALGIEKEDIDLLVDTFYEFQEKLKQRGNFLPEEEDEEEQQREEQKENQRESEKQAEDDEEVDDEEEDEDADKLNIDPDYTFEILREFQERRREKLNVSDLSGNPRQKKRGIVETEQQRDERIKKEERMYWIKMSNVLNEPKLNLWNALYNALSKYYDLLNSRQNLIEETGLLNQQNEELKTLLNQYLLAGVNQELKVPPTQVIKLDI